MQIIDIDNLHSICYLYPPRKSLESVSDNESPLERVRADPQTVQALQNGTKSHFNTRNRTSTLEVALQHSKSHLNTRNHSSTLGITLQHSKSHPNIRNRASILEITFQHPKMPGNIVLSWTCRPAGLADQGQRASASPESKGEIASGRQHTNNLQTGPPRSEFKRVPPNLACMAPHHGQNTKCTNSAHADFEKRSKLTRTTYINREIESRTGRARQFMIRKSRRASISESTVTKTNFTPNHALPMLRTTPYRM